MGGLRLLWIERRTAMGRKWRVRLLWLGSAGGLGGLRVYIPGVVGGIGMATWSYWHRGEDLPIPLFSAFIFAPYYALLGFWWARSRTVGTAALVGAVTALVGFELVTLATAVYTAVTEFALKSVAWLVFGLGYALLVGFVGAICGLIGGALARPTAIIRALGR
jgi:hypothetical protein